MSTCYYIFLLKTSSGQYPCCSSLDNWTKINLVCFVSGFEFCQAKIVAIRCAGAFVDTVGDGQRCSLILDRTCLYAEQGGQIYDQGYINLEGQNGLSGELVVQKVMVQAGYVLHQGSVVDGRFKCGDTVSLSFDTNRRRLIMNNHTGTHILNHALRAVLGPDTHQKGSLVAPDRLRFDFVSKVGNSGVLFELWI